MASRNPFYLMAGLYFIVDAVVVALFILITAGVLPPFAGLSWARVHLLTIGVVTQAIFGTLHQRATLRATTPAGVGITGATWLLLNVGFAILLVSMPAGQVTIAAIGAGSIFSAVVLLITSIRRLPIAPISGARSGALFYRSGPIFFLVGITMALGMLLGWSSPGGYFGLIEAHVHANVWGFLALLVAGVLIERIPAHLNTPLRFPGLVPLTAWLLIIGAIGLVVGPWAAILPLTILGIGVYVAGTALLLANLTGTVRAARGWTANLTHLLIAYVWMVVPAIAAPLIVLATGRLPTDRVETAAVAGLVAGWILQIVVGAFIPGFYRTTPDPARSNGSWLAVISINVGVTGLWLSPVVADDLASLLVVIGYTLIVIGLLPPLASLLRQLGTSQLSAGDA